MTTLDAQGVPEAPPLTNEYHHARRNLNFASALLLGVEFLGVRIQNAHESSGIKFTIVSPGAAPWVLVAVVLFFLMRFKIEWDQCHPARRLVRAAKLDRAVTYIIAVAAIGLFAYQRAAANQVFDVLARSHKQIWIVVVGAGLGYAFFRFVFDLRDAWRKRFRLDVNEWIDAVRQVLFFGLFFWFWSKGKFENPQLIVGGFALGAALGIAAALTAKFIDDEESDGFGDYYEFVATRERLRAAQRAAQPHLKVNQSMDQASPEVHRDSD